MAFISPMVPMEMRSSMPAAVFSNLLGDVHDQPQVVLDERLPRFLVGLDALDERRLVLPREGRGQGLRPVYVLQVVFGKSEQLPDIVKQRMQADGVFHNLSFLSFFLCSLS